MLLLSLAVSVFIPPYPDPLFTDADGDGYIRLIEERWDCDPNDAESFPYCVPDYETPISCYPTGPGISVPLEPCDL